VVYATGLGVTPDKILAKWAEAIDRPTEPEMVDSGPVKENVPKGDKADLGRLSITVWTPKKDPSPYITGAYVVTKDPETGIRKFGVDEFSVAGTLNNGPIELVKCETIDLEVPAQAGIVIEGEVSPRLREMGGRLGSIQATKDLLHPGR